MASSHYSDLSKPAPRRRYVKKKQKSEPHVPTMAKEFIPSSAHRVSKSRPVSVLDLSDADSRSSGGVDVLTADARRVPLGDDHFIRPHSPVEIYSFDGELKVAQSSTTPNGGPRSSVSGRSNITSNEFQQDQSPAAIDEENSDARKFAKQVRTARQSIKNVLLRRTQIQHAHQDLEALRHDFHAQIDKLVVSVQGPDPFSPSSRPKMKRRKKSKGQKSKNGRSDMAAEFPLDQSNIETSPKQFDGEEKSPGIEKCIHDTPVHRSPQPIGDEFYPVYSRLCQQERNIKAQVDQLTNLEYVLSERLESILQVMRSSDFAGVLQAEMLDDQLSISDAASRKSSVHTTNPLLEKYFSKAGDVGIYMERIQELELDHKEGIQAREFLADRGEEVKPSDEDFERNHHARRAQLELEFRSIQDEAESLRRQCLEAGLDVETRRTAPLSVYTDSRDQTSSNQSEPGKIRQIDYRSNHNLPGSTSSERIHFWMEKSGLDVHGENVHHQDLADSSAMPLFDNAFGPDGGTKQGFAPHDHTPQLDASGSFPT